MRTTIIFVICSLFFGCRSTDIKTDAYLGRFIYNAAAPDQSYNYETNLKYPEKHREIPLKDMNKFICTEQSQFDLIRKDLEKLCTGQNPGGQ